MKLTFPYVVNHLTVEQGKRTVIRNGKNVTINKRTQIPMDWEYITIHNTGNTNSTARNERGWLQNSNNRSETGFHIAIDEKEAIECLPLNEVAWHAGDGRGNGNMKSIGIEICESGNYNKTMTNTIQLVANLLYDNKKDTKILRQHNDWSGKNCPRLIRSGHLGWTWQKFIIDVNKELKRISIMNEVITLASKYFKDVSDTQWKIDMADLGYERGIISGKSEGVFDPDSPITRIEATTVVNRAIDYIFKELRNKKVI